jgi:hypothetical protein
MVAHYDLATRLVMQIRGLVVAGATPLTPAFARFKNPADPGFGALLEKATRVSALAAVVTAFLSLAGAPLMSLVILGKMDSDLLRMSTALTLGWSINLLCLGSYMAAQGIGLLRWKFISHTVLALCVLIGVFALVPAFGADGLLAAAVAGLVLGAMVVLVGNELSVANLGGAPKSFAYLMIAALFILASSFIVCWGVAR